MTELEKKLSALYLAVDSSIADSIKQSVMEVVVERDKYKAALKKINADCYCGWNDTKTCKPQCNPCIAREALRVTKE